MIRREQLQQTQSDAELITRARTADAAAQSALYERHTSAANALARQISRNHADADDLVAEAFAKVFGVIGRGGGPDVAFRPYLLTTVRRLAYDRTSREQRVTPAEDPTEGAPGTPFSDTALLALDQTLVATAFRQLPERWQAVLWHVEVEQRSPVEVGEILGIRPNAVSALAYRAREGLRRAYLQAHISSDLPPKCRRVAGHLGTYVRGGLASREKQVVDDHLDECERCRALYAELADVNDGMRRVIAPMVLGPFAAAYTAAMVSGGKSGILLTFGKAGRRIGRQARRAVSTPASAAVTVAASVAAVAIVATTLVALQPDKPASQTAAPGPTPSVTQPEATPSTLEPPVETDAPVEPSDDIDAADDSATTLAPLGPPPTAADSPSPTTAPSTPTTAPTPTTTPTPTTSPPTTVSPPTTTEPPPAQADLSLTGQQVGSLVVGRTGFISATLTNAGPDTADDLTVTGDFPQGVRPISGRGSTCVVDEQTVTCELDPLAPGEHHVWFTVAIDEPPTGAITVKSTSSATDPTPGDSTASFLVETVGAGFSTRYATVDHAVLSVHGNTVLTCDISGTSCHDRETPSTAEVAIDGEVLFAGLYWSGILGNPNIDDDGEVELGGPGAAVETVEASEFLTAGNGYQAFANVTDLVAEAGGGSYMVAGVHTNQGENVFGGWSLVVVQTDDEAPLRNIVVTDGLARSSGSALPPVVIGGFQFTDEPEPPPGSATLHTVCYEGDRDQTDGGMTLDGEPVDDDNGRAVTDIFNSNVSEGLDHTEVDVSDALAPGATALEVGFPGGQDQFWLGVVALVADR